MTLGFGGLNLGITFGAGLKIWQRWRSLKQEVLEATTDRPCMGSGDEDMQILPLSSLKPPCPCFVLSFVICDELTGSGTNLCCWYSLAFRPYWYNPAGSEHACNEPFMFFTYLHRHMPLNWNQHRIFRLFIFSNFFLLLNSENFTKDPVTSSVETGFLHEISTCYRHDILASTFIYLQLLLSVLLPRVLRLLLVLRLSIMVFKRINISKGMDS